MVHGIILLIATVPLAISLINYKLNFDLEKSGKYSTPAVAQARESDQTPISSPPPGATKNLVELSQDPRTLISDIASQITFLAITVCILALSDYWDFRSDHSSSRMGYALPQIRFLQSITVFLLSALMMLNFLMYYSEILSVTVWDFRMRKTASAEGISSVDDYYRTAAKVLWDSSLLLVSSLGLYLSYFAVQTEQKLLGKLFRSYDT